MTSDKILTLEICLDTRIAIQKTILRLVARTVLMNKYNADRRTTDVVTVRQRSQRGELNM